jgi:tRNA-2-methylthio-N6-dimethylallyladenosine synthase
MPRKLYMETFGCQMNVLDSELVLGQLRAHGYESVADRDDADVIIYNTCSVREHAEQKVWSRLGELRERKAADPNLVIGVIGCMAERDGVNLFKRHPHVDILCGPGELDRLATLVHNASVTGNAGAVVGEAAKNGQAAGTGEGASSGEATNNGEGASTGERASTGQAARTVNAASASPRPRQVALMGAAVRRSSTLEAAEDHLELLDLSRSISPSDDLSQAYVRITRGCNKFCTYCVVPYTRGPEVHRPPTNIIEEVRKLTDAGAKEVTLLGQTINHYCFEHGDGRKTTFADLLYMIHEATPALPRLRFVTSFPRDFSDLALAAMRDCPRICRYLHAPAQHGSDRVLKLMNRGYTAGQYYAFVDRAREYLPDVCIASDFIVGFPTETEAEFEQTIKLVRDCRFKNSFIFKYSPRPGTTAIDRFADDVPEEVKRRRNNELLAAQAEVSAQANREMIGKTVRVLVEGESKLVSRREAAADRQATRDETRGGGHTGGFVELGWEKRGQARIGTADISRGVAVAANRVERDATFGGATRTQLVGRTSGDQVVVFDGETSLKGELLDVEIIDARNLTLFGKLPAAVASV